MTIWAIADLHLSFGVPDKGMEAFGPQWEGWTDKVADAWKERVAPDDLVLLAGDISWAKKMEEALPDLEWIDALPGTKVMIRGNHDYWWSAISKVRAALPPSIHAIQNDAFEWGDYSIGGARLWDTASISFNGYVIMTENPLVKETEEPNAEQTEKIYQRELGRLEMSLKCLNQKAKKRIVMTHYPPVNPEMHPSAASELLKKYHVDHCVFGHLHNAVAGSLPFGTAEGITYTLTACDYIDFDPIKVLPMIAT